MEERSDTREGWHAFGVRKSARAAGFTRWLSRRARLCTAAGSHPIDANARRFTQPNPELRHMMLNVADGHDLMLCFRHSVPREPTLAIEDVERVHAFNHLLADAPIFQHLRLGVRLTGLRRSVRQFAQVLNFRGRRYVVQILNPSLVMFPRAKSRHMRLEV